MYLCKSELTLLVAVPGVKLPLKNRCKCTQNVSWLYNTAEGCPHLPCFPVWVQGLHG